MPGESAGITGAIFLALFFLLILQKRCCSPFYPSSLPQLFLPLILFILFQCSFSLFSFPALDLCFLSFIHSTICWFLCRAQQWLRHAIVTTFMELILSGVGWWTEKKSKVCDVLQKWTVLWVERACKKSGWVEGQGNIAVVNRMLW